MPTRKRIHVLAAVLLAAGLLCTGTARRADAGVSVSIFYENLAPYGEWIEVREYGTCWRPARVSRSWQPYLHGEWLYTDYGWTWASSDPWGGDPYHYGTWVYTVEYGWIWIPGTTWAPAWVTWSVHDSYIGWAPVPPSFVIGASGYFGPAIAASYRSYVFVPATRFVGVDVATVRVSASQAATLIASAEPVTRFATRGGALTNVGPSLDRVERLSRRQISRVSLERARTRAAAFSSDVRRGRASVVAPREVRDRSLVGRGARTLSRERGGPAARARSVDRRDAPSRAPRRMAPERRPERPSTVRRMGPSRPQRDAVHRRVAPSRRERAAPPERRIAPPERSSSGRRLEPQRSYARPAPVREPRQVRRPPQGPSMAPGPVERRHGGGPPAGRGPHGQGRSPDRGKPHGRG